MGGSDAHPSFFAHLSNLGPSGGGLQGQPAKLYILIIYIFQCLINETFLTKNISVQITKVNTFVRLLIRGSQPLHLLQKRQKVATE